MIALCALALGTEFLLLEVGWNNAVQHIFYNLVNLGGGEVFEVADCIVWSTYEILVGARAR